MKKRNPLAVFGLSIITLGIYDLYWLYVTKKELNEKTSIHTPTLWMLVAGPILIVVAYIMLFAGGLSTTTNNNLNYNYGGASATAGGHLSAVGIAGLILVFVGWIITIILSIIWIFKFSKAINEYTKGKMSTAVTFLIMYLIHLIGVALIQDTFNDMIDNPGGSTGAATHHQAHSATPPQPPAQPAA